MGCVYLITRILDGKCYVGKTKHALGNRWSGHQSVARAGKGFKLHAAMRRYGIHAFDIQVLGESSTESVLNELEQMWIILLNARSKEYGFNLTAGGEGAVDRVPSAETRTRLSLSAKKRIITPEVCARMSASAKLRRRGSPSQATRDKISASLKDRPHTPERCANIRTGRWGKHE